MTTPSRWVVGVLCALAGCGGGVLGGGDVGPARWEVRADPGPTDDVLRILVEEVACASGQPATGRIDVDVDERDDSIELDVRVRARPGDQTCPGNPRTPFVVRLDSPVGDRTVEGARRGIDSADDTTAAVRVVLDPPRSIPEIASER